MADRHSHGRTGDDGTRGAPPAWTPAREPDRWNPGWTNAPDAPPGMPGAADEPDLPGGPGGFGAPDGAGGPGGFRAPDGAGEPGGFRVPGGFRAPDGAGVPGGFGAPGPFRPYPEAPASPPALPPVDDWAPFEAPAAPPAGRWAPFGAPVPPYPQAAGWPPAGAPAPPPGPYPPGGWSSYEAPAPPSGSPGQPVPSGPYPPGRWPSYEAPPPHGVLPAPPPGARPPIDVPAPGVSRRGKRPRSDAPARHRLPPRAGRLPHDLPPLRRRPGVWLGVLVVIGGLVLATLGWRAAVLAGPDGSATDPASAPAGAAGRAAPDAPPAVPAGTARFAPMEPVVVLDTRQGAALAPGATRTLRLPGQAGKRPAAVALSVTTESTRAAGAVTVSGAVPAARPQLRVAGAGAATTALVVVAVDRNRAVRVQTSAGGHLVVDLVGAFEPVRAATAAGRIVVVPPQRVAHRVTAVVGHDGTVPALRPAAVPDRGVAAALVRVTADVGRRGGILRLGPSPSRLGTTVHWSPPTTVDNKRQALAFVPLSPVGQLAVSYHGGFVLDIELLAYVTNRLAPPSVAGLFLPAARADVLDARLPAGRSARLAISTGLPVDAGRITGALLTVAAESNERSVIGVVESGRPARPVLTSPGQRVPRSTLVPVTTGRNLAVRTERAARVHVDVVGVLLAR